MALLDITDLTVAFPGRRGTTIAVEGASLTVAPGEIHGLVGESGAGKSTVGAAVMGLLDRPGRITGGQIAFRDRQINGLDASAMQALRGKRLSMIFQDPMTSLNPLLTVGAQLSETIRTHLDVSARQATERARDLLEQVGIPDPAARLEQYPHEFSGGQRQRVVIALALCSEPEVIIADEPTTALDVAVQAQILDLIRDLVRTRQIGVILITHDMGVIADTTDRVTVMYHGSVVETGPTAQVLGQPAHAYTRSLIAAVPRPDRRLHRFPRVQYDRSTAEFDVTALAQSWPHPRPDARGPALVEVTGLTKRFIQTRSLIPARRRYATAVDDVSFDIRPGEVLGLVGESGSGKSTVARIIAGLHRADAGRVVFDGQRVNGGVPADVLRGFQRSIQMVFQDPYSSLNPRMRVDAIVAEPIRHHRLASGRALAMRVDSLLDQVGLGAAAGLKYPHEFSGGQRQRISIARALATQPRFLICDEPTSALDVSIQAQILNILKDLQEHLGLTMLFISHDLPVVRQMCDRVAVMQAGRLMELQPTEALFEAPQTEYTRGLLSLMPRLAALEDGAEA